MDLIDKIVALEKKAADFGFVWEDANQIMAQIQSECLEVQEHLSEKTSQNHNALQEEVGDLFHAVFSLSVFCGLNPEETIKKTTEKFERRLSAVQNIAKAQGLPHLKNHTFDELMSIWDKAKQAVG